MEDGILSFSRLGFEETWHITGRGCWEVSSVELGGWGTWFDTGTTLVWGISSWLFRQDGVELPIDPRWRLRRGAGTIPANPTWASNPRPLVSGWLLRRLERNVLFFGTGLNPTEEPSDGPPEGRLASSACSFFSGDMGSEGNTTRPLSHRLHTVLHSTFIFC